ncbi:alpha/beta hydrolase [Pedobacter insulae]|uniref:Acetyl esterase/lipase n=1 Tax=Pedobacter insulae TaxID=414048 RepID=A0A1I2TQC6_9SPHI|nr:alpha/beta hydrolase [Pedobacter insulae]SFG67074.1 Acetyl esterase/lipase [Pedobacter insulae]
MKHVFRRSLVLFIVASSFLTCKKGNKIITDPVIKVEAATFTDVSYGSNPHQKMDVYLPANRSASTNLIIFVHGGSFIEGDKSDFTSLVKELVRANFAVLNINYRLVDATGLYDNPVKHLESAVKIKDQIADVASVVNYALSKAREWEVSETKLGIAGHSAGATLALLYSYDNRNTNKVKAVVNLAGSLDQTFADIPPFMLQFLPDYILEAGYRYTGYTVATENDQHYKAISPLFVANSNQKVPTLTVFPENNEVGDLPKQGRSTFDAFTNKLNSLGIPNKFVQLQGADHGFTKMGNVDAVLKETIAYFNANLK